MKKESQAPKNAAIKKIFKKKAAPSQSVKAPQSPRRQEEKKEKAPFLGIHNLRPPAGSHKRRKLLGRGSSSGHGKTSTRGSKGQTSRSGRATYPGFEGGQMPLIRKVPKRGFVSKFKKVYQLVNIKDLARINEPLVTPEILEKRGVIKDRNKPVKILGDGELSSAVTIHAHTASSSAAEKIKNAGGKLQLIDA